MRTSIACLENVVSSAERRGILTGESRIMPRICDLTHVLAATRGKVELMLSEDGQGAEDRLIEALVGEAVKEEFEKLSPVERYEPIVEQFEQGLTLSVGDDVSAAQQVASMKHVRGLVQAARELCGKLKLDADDEQVLAGVGELILEALFVNNRLSKHTGSAGVKYGR